MTRDEALKKVLKCLSLAKSANEHEAAAALRQARKLMQEYGLGEAEALASGYAQASAKTRARGAMVPRSIAWLAHCIAEGFGCTWVADCRPGSRTDVVFVGSGASARIAAYAFDVMRRQLDGARLKHIARVKKRANREARGEAFAIGWVRAVQALFPAAEMTEEQRQQLTAAYQAMFPNTTTSKARQVGQGGKAKADDEFAGWLAGKQARFAQGVEGEAQRRIGHG